MSGADFDPDAYLAQAQPEQQATIDPASIPAADGSPQFDPDSYLENANQEQYGTEDQQLKAGLEGVAKGFAGPVATYAETHLLGVKPEDIEGRADANPWTSGAGQVAGLGLGLWGPGEAALLARAGGAVAEAANLGKVGSMALKGAIEAGLFQGGDEISNALLGKSDPEAPVSSALAHMGAASLLGAGGGALFGKAANKLEEIANMKTGSSASKMLADFGSRFNFLTKNDDLAGAATDEARNLYEAVSSASDAVWGGPGLKDQAIQKLVPEMNQGIAKQTQELATKLQSTISDMAKDPDTFPPRLKKTLENDVNSWMSTATDPNASSFDSFKATQDLKQKLQYYSKFGKQINPLAPEGEFVNSIKGLGSDLRAALEDKSVWGKAAELQQGINGAFTKLKPYQDDFLRSFSTKVLGEREVDPDKIASIIRQTGRGRGAIRAGKLGNFLEPAQKFLQEVDSLHNELGVQNSIPKVSTNVLDEMMNKPASPGSKLADSIFGGAPKSIGMAGAHVAGTAIGAAVGHPLLGYMAGEHLAPIIEEGIGRKLTRSGVSAVLKALSSGNTEGIPQAINYAEGIAKGGRKINEAVDNVFTVGGQKYLNHDFSETAREHLKKYVADGQMNQEIQNQKTQALQAQAAAPAQAFAHGGPVLAPEPRKIVTKPVPTATKGMDHVSAIFPEHAPLLGSAKGRINNYLNSVRPSDAPTKLPFDDAHKDPEKERNYDKALNIAMKPLSVLDHVKNGSLTPEHVQHMQQLYPELSNHLRGKLAAGITKAQMENKKPPHHVMQSLSLFMGSPMDSTLTPAAIQAAQSTFMAQKGPMQPGGDKQKGSTQKMDKIAPHYQTRDQAAEARQIVKS